MCQEVRAEETSYSISSHPHLYIIIINIHQIPTTSSLNTSNLYILNLFYPLLSLNSIFR
jgi:hypothetical protein